MEDSNTKKTTDTGSTGFTTTAQRRQRGVVISLAIGMVIAGTFAALLSMIRPLNAPFFVPIWITQYDTPLLPIQNYSERDRIAILDSDIFDREESTELSNPTQIVLRGALDQLSQHAGHDSIVVYINAMTVDDKRGLCIIPSDGNPLDPSSFVPLRDILTSLAKCSAIHTLLVLDVQRSFSDPRLGVFHDGLTERIIKDLEAVPDEGRLTLLAAASGQWARTSHVLNRSVFGYYFEQGLLGAADGYNEAGNRNARVSAKELATYLAAHVDRWARLVDGMRQLPELLGKADDFELSVALPPDQLPPDALATLYPEPKPKKEVAPASVASTAKSTAPANTTSAPATGAATAPTSSSPAPAAASSTTPATPDAAPASAVAAGSASPNDKSSSSPAAAAATSSGSPQAAGAAPSNNTPSANPANGSVATTPSAGANTATANDEASPADVITYPDWLFQAWKLHDQWRDQQAYRVAPRVYQQMSATLLRASLIWQNANPDDHLAEAVGARINQLKSQYEKIKLFPRPRPFSLAAAELRGDAPDLAVVTAVNDDVNKWQSSQAPPAKPEEAAAAEAKLIQAFGTTYQSKSPFAVEYAVHAAAASDTTLSLEKLKFLNALRKSVYPDPHYLETRLIDRLASLNDADIESSQAASNTRLQASWRLLLAQAIQLDLRAEQAVRRPLDFGWLADRLEPAERLCWESEVLLLSMGYVPFELAQSKVARANTAFQEIQAMAETLESSCNLLQRTTCDLSLNLSTDRRGGQLTMTWDDAVDASLAIDQTLYSDRNANSDPLASPVRNEQLRQNNIAIESCLESLMAPFSSTNINGIMQECQEPSAPGRLRVNIESLVETTFIDAESRRALALADRRLERKLAKAVLELDRMETKSNRLAPAPTLSVSDRENTPAEERRRSLADARRTVMLLELVGYDPLEIKRFNTLADEASTDSNALDELKYALRDVWAKGLAERMAATKDVAVQARLSLAFHPFAANAMLDDVSANPVRQIMIADHQRLWTWIAGELDFQSRDSEASNLLASAAREFGQFASVPPNTHPVVTHEFDTDSPADTSGRVTGRISIQLFGEPGKEPTIGDLLVLTANKVWFNVTLGKREIDPSFSSSEEGSRRYLIPFQIELIPGAFGSGVPQPRGFLVQIPIDGRQFHHAVTLPDPSPFTPYGLEVWIGKSAANPERSVGEMRLRPLGTTEEYFLFLLNRTTVPEKLQVAIRLGADSPATVTAPVEVAPGATVPVLLPKQPLPKEELAKLSAPVVMEIARADQPSIVVRRFEMPITIISPSEYVRIAYARFEPAAPPDIKRNRLSIVVEQTESVGGPPINVELTFPKDLLKGYQGEMAGVMRSALTPSEGRRMLVAEGMEFDATSPRAGSFAVNVDGVERAFLFDGAFPIYGTPSSPTLVNEPRLRIDAPGFTQPTPAFSVRIPIDGAPTEGRLSVMMGAKGENTLGQIITVDQPRDRRVGCQLAGPNGGMLISATIRDNTFNFDTNGMSGPQRLEASFTPPQSAQSISAETTVYVDARPPILEFFDVPQKISANLSLPVELVVKDLDVPVEQVRLLFGPLAKDGSVPPGSELFDAELSDPRVGLWKVTLPLPAGTKKGPIVLTALATNRAGLVANRSMKIEVTDAPPAGKIEGVITVGSLRQPACEVYLVDAKGKIAQKTKTDANGVFRFDSVTPGKFKVTSASQSSSQIRAGATEVTIVANKTVNVSLDLTLSAAAPPPVRR